MAVHNNIRFLHIGCDEVFQIGECSRCRTQTRDNLFLSHVAKVAQYVRSKYANVVPLIWDDMLRHLPPISLEQYRIGELVEPMVRKYNGFYLQRIFHKQCIWYQVVSVI